MWRPRRHHLDHDRPGRGEHRDQSRRLVETLADASIPLYFRDRDVLAGHSPADVFYELFSSNDWLVN
ncbi:hypothetical protein [Corynebacterium jeddahense]|uniref:hypothetical protein n=1 Tax=Corynebacterium jeddahense TaxID=1414719 RepID=UPI0004AD95A6|nr:hypothetical protein [Corynebacterium jeddahense]